MHLQLNHQGGPLSVLQITDTHLGASAASRLAGVNTHQSLAAVLAAVRRAGEADLLLLTGDLSDDGSPQAYQALDSQLVSLGVSQAWLPGNHDDRACMEATVPERMVHTIAAGNWGIILLNSQIPGAVGGALAAGEINRLAAFLADPAHDFILVCVHHHPLPIASRWLDEQRIANADELLGLIDRCPRVRGLIWGHIHQVYDAWRGSVRLLGAPSTCVQFAPGCERFKVDQLGPGWRKLRLHEDGRLETRVYRLDGELAEIDYGCQGY